jgi:predicted membrane protein (TIGR00267 family)
MGTRRTRRDQTTHDFFRNPEGPSGVTPSDVSGHFKNLAPSPEITEVMRRYLMLSMFDGALTGFGIVAGNYFMGIFDSRATLSAIFGATLALAAASALSAYEAESTFEDAKRTNKKLGHNGMLDAVSRAIDNKRARLSIIYAVIAHTMSPLPALLAAAVPFLLFPSREASVYSLSVLGLTVFIFGVYVGTHRKRNGVWYGVKYLLITVLIAAFLLLTSTAR